MIQAEEFTLIKSYDVELFKYVGLKKKISISNTKGLGDNDLHYSKMLATH